MIATQYCQKVSPLLPSYPSESQDVRQCLNATCDYDLLDRRLCRQMLRGFPPPNKVDRPALSTEAAVRTDNLPLDNCDCFRHHFGFMTSFNERVTEEELRFPVAFSLLTYDNMEQTMRLLRLIYRPHNLYCLHVDAKSPPSMHRTARRAVSCIKNVVLAAPAIEVSWGTVSVLEAELLCARKLLESKSVGWKYFINLVGRDFPLRTNLELVRILKAYNGTNDVAVSK
jgi:Core-2/I-Branching enzyme